MNSVATFRQRLNWTRGWLNTFTASQSSNADDFEVISPQLEDAPLSNYGVESLSSDCSHSECQESVHSARYYCWESTCKCRYDHSGCYCDVCRHCPGNCIGRCPTCAEARFAREGRSYCWICNGDCCNNRPKEHPDDDPNVDNDFKFDREELNGYELAGREATNTFRDLRSASKARKRKRREREKYFHHKAVKPGWLDKKFFDLRDHQFTAKGVLLEDATVKTMTKQMMYEEAQWYPRPPTYHRRKLDKEYYPWGNRKGWRHCEGRKHAQHYVNNEVAEGREEAEFLQRDPNMWTSSGWPWGPDGFAEDTEIFWVEPKFYDWCDTCDVHWGNCIGWRRCIVDEVSSLRIQWDKETGKWEIQFEIDAWQAERPNRAPATIPYGKRDWIRHPYPEHFTEDDAD